MNATALKPAADRLELPATALTVADMEGDAPILFGRLVSFAGRCRRPFVAVLVDCECGRRHVLPHRWNWGLSAEVVSYQLAPCPDGPRAVWVALDPELSAENASTHARAHEAYVAWEAERERRKKVRKRARQKAARAAEAAATASDPAATPQAPSAATEAPSSKPRKPTPARSAIGLAGRLASRRAATPITAPAPSETGAR